MGKKQRARALPATTVAVAGMTLLNIAAARAAPIYQWSGFYVGINAGGAWQSYDFGGSFDGFSTSKSSFLVGAFGGYNTRWGNLVFGGEANLDGLIGNNNTPVFGTTLTPSTGWEAAIRGRAGYLFTPGTLGYVAAGPAWTNVRASFPSITQNDTSLGWTVGGGMEMVMPGGNWRFRVEYDFSHFSARPFEDLPTSLDVHAFKAGFSVPLPKGSSDR